jgi:hypothetical protein
MNQQCVLIEIIRNEDTAARDIVSGDNSKANEYRGSDFSRLRKSNLDLPSNELSIDEFSRPGKSNEPQLSLDRSFGAALDIRNLAIRMSYQLQNCERSQRLIEQHQQLL